MKKSESSFTRDTKQIEEFRNAIKEERFLYSQTMESIEEIYEMIRKTKTEIINLVQNSKTNKINLEEEKDHLLNEKDLLVQYEGEKKKLLETIESKNQSLKEAYEKLQQDLGERNSKIKEQEKIEANTFLQIQKEEKEKTLLIQSLEEEKQLLQKEIEDQTSQVQLLSKKIEEQTFEIEKSAQSLKTLNKKNQEYIEEVQKFLQRSSSIQKLETDQLNSNVNNNNTNPMHNYKIVWNKHIQEGSVYSIEVIYLNATSYGVLPNFYDPKKIPTQIWCGLAEGTIRIWDVETLIFVGDRKSHSAPVTSILQVAEKIWSCSHDKSLIIWHPKKLQPLKKLQAGNKDKDPFGTVLIEIDLCAWNGCSDGVIRIWDGRSLKLKKEMKVDEHKVTYMVQKSHQVWTGNEKGTIHVFHKVSFKLISTIIGHVNKITSFINVGPFEIWSCSLDKTIKAWHAENFSCIKTIKMETGLLCLLQIRELNQVFSGSQSEISVWNCKTYEQIQTISHLEDTSCLIVDKYKRIWGATDQGITIWEQEK